MEERERESRREGGREGGTERDGQTHKGKVERKPYCAVPISAQPNPDQGALNRAVQTITHTKRETDQHDKYASRRIGIHFEVD